ncbi:major facilitator superfamily domain-containing protein [Leptodontidium sp. MPI-SDFR-AT-0119]|nr:major facilitator superfamily domain-containing protein [Leptodontidium sp. MPI-SDFR-AT-0119]
MWRGTNTSVKGAQDDLTGGEDESSIPLLSVDEMADDKSPLLPSRDVFIGSESESSSVQFGGQEKVPWWSYIWDYDPERTKEERRFLQKLDVSLLTILSLGYFIKNLDQTNISNAYVSGMKEALQMNANELNMIDVAWTTGYVIGQLPSQFILTKVRPSIWIPSCELVWTVLTFSLAAASSSKQVIAIRFLVGLLGKRACIFHASSAAAGMFSGYLQAAVYKGMNGTLGKEGWQWLFIMDGLISLPICLAGFFLIPDLPENTRAFYLTEDDAERARKRMRDVGRAPRKELGWSILKRTFARWHVYGLTLLYVVFINTGPSGSVAPLALWLKSRGFPVSLVNIIPTGQSAVQLVTTIGFAILSDFLRNRPLVMGISASFGFLSYLLLSIWNIPTTLKYIAYFIGRGAVAFGPLAMSWANEICGPDAEERAIVLGVMNASGYAVNTWLPVLTYPVKDAPRFKKGFRFSAVAIVGQVVVMGGVWALKRREDRRRRRRGPRSRVEGSGFVRLED